MLGPGPGDRPVMVIQAQLYQAEEAIRTSVVVDNEVSAAGVQLSFAVEHTTVPVFSERGREVPKAVGGVLVESSGGIHVESNGGQRNQIFGVDRDVEGVGSIRGGNVGAKLTSCDSLLAWESMLSSYGFAFLKPDHARRSDALQQVSLLDFR